MHKRICWLVFPILMLFIINSAYSQQQDVEFHLNAHLLNGQKILKVKRDFHDIYLWVLGENNTLYRVNSLTLAIDDYTSKFSAYKSFQFVDIMGHSADTVFVATNSSNVIEWTNGTFRVIGSGDGIPGIVNSLGVDLGWNLGFNTRNDMIIGTNNGLRTFDPKTQTLGFLPDTGAYATNSKIANSRIFESTYRSETYKDSTDGDVSNWANSATHYMPVMYSTSNIYTFTGPLVCSYIWEGNSIFGNNVNTVFALNNGVLFYDNGYWADYFWGSEKGMFQTEAANSWNNITADVWSQYLNGIKVNKITDIMGLTGFNNNYDSGLIKENLLIGTDIGFYFSSSIYDPVGLYPGKFALFHDDELGSTVINDICVNAVPNFQPICEDGVWLGANDGLYLLKPDYAKYFNNQQQKLVSFSNQPDTLSQMQVCALSPLSANVKGTFNNIQWYKDGAELPGQSKDTLAITAAGDYYAVIYDPCEAIHIESNHLKVSVIAGPVFTFNYPNMLQYCDSASTTLKTTYSPSYHYQWYTNGVLNGDTTSSFLVTQTGKYKVDVSACTNSWVPSKEVQVNLSSVPEPGISIDKIPYCYGDTAHFTSTWLMDTTAFTLRWYKDNALLPALNNQQTIKTIIPGIYTLSITDNKTLCSKVSPPYQLSFTPPPAFTFNYPAVINYCQGNPVTLTVQGDPNYQYRWYKDGTLTGDVTAALAITQAGKYKVEVSACTNSWVPSKEIQVNFTTLPLPVITTDKPAYCIGDIATLSIAAPVDPGYSINWYKDNALVAPNTNQNSITTNVAGNYTVSIVSNTINTDGSICSQTSGGYSLSFNPPPTLSIEKIVNTTICDGQTIGLLAHYNGGTVKWSTGETTDQISVTTPGNYRATVTSAAGCIADTSIPIAFLPNPVFSVNDTSVCTYKKQVITLSAPPGFAQYAWNGTPGGQTYEVSHPQTVSLTVTDVNGCQASQQIKVVDQCPNVYIPNAFTPNGDGINDTWVIEGLDNDATASVKVFTRYGNLIFDSKGYGTPWNGEYNGKKLPAAVYYYIVTAKNGKQKFSGSVTIIY